MKSKSFQESITSHVLIRAYDRLALNAKSLNQLNALHISIEDKITPGEEAALVAHVSPFLSKSKYPLFVHSVLATFATFLLRISRGSTHLTSSTRKFHQMLWASKRLAQIRSLGLGKTLGYERVWSRKSSHLYRLQGEPQATIIAVAGGMGRLGMPAPTILRYFAKFSCDVLLLSKRHGDSYATGVPGLGSTWSEVGEAISSIVGNRASGKLLLFSVSKGTTMGVALAELLGIENGIIASPSSFKPEVELTSNEKTGVDLDRAGDLSYRKGLSSDFLIAYSSDIERDSSAAREIQSLLPNSRMMPISGAPHVVIYPLAQRCQLLDVLSSAFRLGIGNAPNH